MAIKLKENFTEEFLADLKPEASAYLVADLKTPNFMCRVNPRGNKTYIYKRCVNRKPVVITIGLTTDIKLKDARKRACELAAEVLNNKKFLKERDERREMPTLAEFFDNKYIPLHAEKYTKPQVCRDGISIFDRYFRSQFGSEKLDNIDRDTIEKLHIKLKNQRTIYVANSALALIKKVLNKAVEWNVIKYNPVMGIKKYTEKPRERFLQSDELKNFFQALDEEPDSLFRDYVYISLFTGQRRSNVLTMRWDQIDWVEKVWRIPETKNGSSLNVPLIPKAIGILKGIKANSVSPWVFYSQSSASKHLVEPKKFWKKLLNRAGIENLRIHDIRRTLGSYEAMAGVNLPLISKTLGHRSFQATQIYARMNVESVRAAITSAVDLMEKRAGLSDEATVFPFKEEIKPAV